MKIKRSLSRILSVLREGGIIYPPGNGRATWDLYCSWDLYRSDAHRALCAKPIYVRWETGYDLLKVAPEIGFPLVRKGAGFRMMGPIQRRP